MNLPENLHINTYLNQLEKIKIDYTNLKPPYIS